MRYNLWWKKNVIFLLFLLFITLLLFFRKKETNLNDSWMSLWDVNDAGTENSKILYKKSSNNYI